MACESVGKELIRAGAIRISDLEEWQNSKNKTINIGIPSYVFLQCFVRSIKSGSVGFVMRMNASLHLPKRGFPFQDIFHYTKMVLSITFIYRRQC